jgi:hypothetical protein
LAACLLSKQCFGLNPLPKIFLYLLFLLYSKSKEKEEDVEAYSEETPTVRENEAAVHLFDLCLASS